MIEKQMQTTWTKHIRSNPPNQSEVWELKIVKTKSLRFDAIRPHQRKALLDAKTVGLYHKLQDIPVTYYSSKSRFTHHSPFDCMFLKDIKAYVVVWFYKPRKQKVFLKIEIYDFISLENNTDRKSFTEDMAMAVGKPVFV